MAFGDKPTWDTVGSVTVDDKGNVYEARTTGFIPGWSDKTPTQIMEDISIMLEAIVSTTVSKPKSEAVACCDDSFNFYVEHSTGIPFCLKCRKTMTKEHFNKVLDAYAERMKASR